MSQLTYLAKPSAALPAGSLADARENDVVTRVNDQGAAVPFGVAMARKADGTVQLPTGAGNFIVGVSLYDQSKDTRSLAGILAVEQGAPMSLLRRGVVWVIVQDACTEGGQVFVRHGGTGQVGGFLGTDDGANSSLLASARWLTSQASPGGLAQLELGLDGAGTMS